MSRLCRLITLVLILSALMTTSAAFAAGMVVDPEGYQVAYHGRPGVGAQVG